MHDALEKKKEILIEGANAMMLDIDFGWLDFFIPYFTPYCDFLLLNAGLITPG